MARSLTIGSAMVDIIVIVADSDIERMTMHNDAASFLLLEQGRKIEASSITDHSGGGAVNAAVSLARQGFDVSTTIKIGRDRDGDRILGRLKRDGIKADCVLRTDELATGTAVMVSSHDKNATIFTQRGANTLLRPDDLTQEMFEGRDLVYVTNLSNRSADCFPHIVDSAHGAGAFVAVNPGIRQLTSRTSNLIETLPKIDLLAMNATEAASLVPAISARCGDSPARCSGAPNLPALARLGLEFGGFSMDLMPFMAAVQSLGVSALVITDGKDGAYLANSEGVFHCPVYRVDVQGTAGAGDAFISTLSGSLVQGCPASEAMQRSTVNAASVILAIDAQSGLLRAEEIDEAIRAQRQQIQVQRLG